MGFVRRPRGIQRGGLGGAGVFRGGPGLHGRVQGGSKVLGAFEAEK